MSANQPTIRVTAAWATETAIATLRREWTAGTSTARIGKVIGVSKNTIVGMANRLELEPRNNPIDGTTWTEATKGQLRALRGRGLTWRQIGGEMNCSPGAARLQAAVIGITDTRPPPRAMGAGAVTLPALASLAPIEAVSVQAPPVSPPPPASRPSQPPVKVPACPRPSDVVRLAPSRSVRETPCCWPIGQPGKPGFRYCDAASVHGKPYCPEHCGKAYGRPRNTESPAAVTGPQS